MTQEDALKDLEFLGNTMNLAIKRNPMKDKPGYTCCYIQFTDEQLDVYWRLSSDANYHDLVNVMVKDALRESLSKVHGPAPEVTNETR